LDTEQQFQRAIAMGEANKRALELVQNWCAHLAIAKPLAGCTE
jgi:hypothetical protein